MKLVQEVTLTLDREEALMLKTVLANVVAGRDNELRMFTDYLYDLLPGSPSEFIKYDKLVASVLRLKDGKKGGAE